MNRFCVWAVLMLVGGVLCVCCTVSAQPPVQPAKQTDASLAAVPTDAFFFVSAKASKLWDLPAAKPLRDWLATQKEDPFGKVIGVSASDVDRVTMFSPLGERAWRNAVMVVTTRKQYNEAKVRKALGVRDERAQMAGQVAELKGRFRWVVFADDRMLVFLPDRLQSEGFAPSLFAQLIVRKPDGPLASLLLDAQQHDFAVGLDVRALASAVPEEEWQEEKQLAPFLLLLKAKTASLTADFDKTAKIQLVLNFPDAQTAKRAAPVVEEGLKTLVESMTEETKRNTKSVKIAVGWASGVLKGAKVTTNGASVVATAEVPYAEDLSKVVAALPEALIDAQRVAATNHLKQLALAMHSFESATDRFPGDVVGGNNPPAWSWRVQILPYIEQANLYQQLDMTKAWDAPANLKVLEAAEMPKVFEHPGRPAPKGHTYFRIFTLPKDAKGTDRPLFKEGERGPRITDITDGTSNTFMIVEAGEAVPWYKPDVLAYDGKLPLPQLGDKEADLFLAAMGDGSVRSLRPSKLGEKTLRALITINGGEVIPDLDK
jgi:hypothetical protein